MGSDNDRVIKNWNKIFGNLKEKLESYKSNKYKLKHIRVNARTDDSHEWIYEGTKEFANLLEQSDIKYTFEEGKGGHSLLLGFPEENLSCFFSEILKTK